MNKIFNVLVSSAGRRVGLINIFRTSLSRLGVNGEVQAADMSLLSSAMESADKKHLIPRCTSSEFIPRMLEICRSEAIRLVVPTIDPELGVWAVNRERFEASGVAVAISSAATVRIARNKRRTHQWLVDNGFPTVRQADAATLLAGSSGWQFPCIAKPARGSASVGVLSIGSPEELRRLVDTEEYVVQELAPGREYTLDVLVSRAGSAVCAVPRKRLEVRAGEVSKGVTVRHAGIEDLGLAICDRLPGAYGVITVQIFLEEASGEMRVIEINPRFGGGFPLAYEAGADYPRWMIEELLEMRPAASQHGWRGGLVMLRFDDAVYVDGSEVGL